MNRMYDSMEPRVIDDDMLKVAVGEQGPREEAGQLAKQEGILFKDVMSLQLDFQNILRIDNLWQFENLRKLQLDNNIIERIEGLENLVHLVWLDLSFNNIEAIEGLDTLVNLEDLSLFNNRISKIDSLDALVKLQVLSLGNNQIGNMMNKKMAEMKHQYSIDEMTHQENQMQIKQEEEQARRMKLEEHKMAFIERLDDSYLFDSMYAEDVEGNKLSYLPGVGDLLVAYKDKFVIICVNIFEYGLKQQEKRKIELDTFNECIQEAIQENQEEGRLKIAKFEEKHFMNLNSIREESDLLNIEKKIMECSEDITELFNVLMTLEMQLVEQLEETINMFERNIIDLVGLFIENVQGLYPFCDDTSTGRYYIVPRDVLASWGDREKVSAVLTKEVQPQVRKVPVLPQTWLCLTHGCTMAQCRDLENHHHEKLLEIAINTLEKTAKGEIGNDLPEDVRALFIDKDTVVNAVGASHDIHLLKIDNREDELVTRVNSWCTHLVDKIHKDEIMRNRKRVKEINQYIDHMQNELDNLECVDIVD
ncbi:dynein regulatory complex subunit 3 isoform X2 [Marmota monax]|uniref:dynein regulatory complex subunit 3 isoform X2 n=1 Tax=Marmota monax TaxID=9995 RepID=UPI0026F16BF0|nr:dynein regulatory complex subunit 3 isoform X2 [Marmota monax]